MADFVIKSINERKKDPIENFIHNDFKATKLSEISKLAVNGFINRVNHMQDLDVIDKIILVSNYLQSSVQYYNGKITEANHKKYEVDYDVDYAQYSNVNSIFEKNIGNCNAISSAFVILANCIGIDSINKVDVGDHSYCIITYHGKIYCIEPTWGCSRNKNQVEGAPKATKFSDEYIMVALSDFTEHHTVERLLTTADNLATEKFDRNVIQNSIKKLEARGIKFEYSDVPVLKTREIKEDIYHEGK